MNKLIEDRILYENITKASIDFAKKKFSLNETNSQIEKYITN